MAITTVGIGSRRRTEGGGLRAGALRPIQQWGLTGVEIPDLDLTVNDPL